MQWDRTGSQIVQMSTEFSELFTREVTNVRVQLPTFISEDFHFFDMLNMMQTTNLVSQSCGRRQYRVVRWET